MASVLATVACRRPLGAAGLRCLASAAGGKEPLIVTSTLNGVTTFRMNNPKQLNAWYAVCTLTSQPTRVAAKTMMTCVFDGCCCCGGRGCARTMPMMKDLFGQMQTAASGEVACAAARFPCPATRRLPLTPVPVCCLLSYVHVNVSRRQHTGRRHHGYWRLLLWVSSVAFRPLPVVFFSLIGPFFP